MNRRMKNPPKLAERICGYLSRSSDRMSLTDDLREEYQHRVSEDGAFMAALWYWRHAIRSLLPLLGFQLFWNINMTANNLKVALRHLKKHRLYSAINILGLSIGLASCLFIYLYVMDEFSYDDFHAQKASLYRVLKNNHAPDGGIKSRWFSLPPTAGPEIASQFPEVDLYTRHITEEGIMRYGDRMFRESIDLVDAPFFEMFSFPLIDGDASTVLAEENTIVVSRRISEKYFGTDNPMGETVTLTFGRERRDYRISGVADDVPSNSSIQFDVLMNIENWGTIRSYPNILNLRLYYSTPVYLLLHEGASVDALAQKMADYSEIFFATHVQNLRDRMNYKGDGKLYSIGMQNITDVHLNQAVYGGKNPKLCGLLALIAAGILGIACINFMNLSMGMASTRSVEVGMRKVLGAGRQTLMTQFWGEYILQAMIAMIAGLGLAGLALPMFNGLVGKSLRMHVLFQWPYSGILLGLVLLTGLLSGGYPALIMARFQPIESLKKRLGFSHRKIFTKGLLVIQFVLSIAMFISALFLKQQLDFMLQSDTGYVQEGLISIPIQEEEESMRQQLVRRFKDRVTSHPSVLGASASSLTFSSTIQDKYYMRAYFEKDDQGYELFQSRVDVDFIPTSGLEIVEGRNFSRTFAGDTAGVIINQAFVQELGFEFPIGRTLGDPNRGFPYYLRIIGIVKDFHFRSLHETIEPVLFHMDAHRPAHYLMVRIAAQDMPGTLSFLDATWKTIQPEKPFILHFQDDILREQYQEEQRWSGIVQSASFFAVLIACMGIFGLTAISIRRRVKEIGIRKVLGANVSQVVRLIIREFIILVVLANAIAWPAAYLIVRRVLQDYSYRIGIGPEAFLLAGAGSILAAVLTILALSVRAALANPVESLRYE